MPNWPNEHVFILWEEAGDNRCVFRENMQTAHRKVGDWNQETSCLEMTIYRYSNLKRYRYQYLNVVQTQIFSSLKTQINPLRFTLLYIIRRDTSYKNFTFWTINVTIYFYPLWKPSVFAILIMLLWWGYDSQWRSVLLSRHTLSNCTSLHLHHVRDGLNNS